MKKITKRSQEAKDGEVDGKKVEEVQEDKTTFIETIEATDNFRKTTHEGSLHLKKDDDIRSAVPIVCISPVVSSETGKSLVSSMQILPAKKKQKIVLSHLLDDD